MALLPLQGKIGVTWRLPQCKQTFLLSEWSPMPPGIGAQLQRQIADAIPSSSPTGRVSDMHHANCLSPMRAAKQGKEMFDLVFWEDEVIVG